MVNGTARTRARVAISAGAMLVVASVAHAVQLEISQGVARPGGETTIEVVLNDEGATVVGTQNDIEFNQDLLSVPEKMVTITLAQNISATDTTIPLSDTSQLERVGTVVIEGESIDYAGKQGNNLTGAVRGSGGTTAAPHSAGAQVRVPANTPDCRVGSGVTGAAFFTYTATGIRAIVLGFGPTDVVRIPNGSVLYTCRFVASGSATVGQVVPLTCSGAQSSDNMDNPMRLPTGCGANQGRIEIRQGCLGDCLEPFGSITAAELASTINAFGRRDPSLNPCADRDSPPNGVQAGELATVINNFGRRQCNP